MELNFAPVVMAVASIKLVLVILISAAHAATTTPTVTIQYPTATIVGKIVTGIAAFSAIPFAQPPTGTLRLQTPRAITKPLGRIVATQPALKCPQQSEQAGDSDVSENCLTLDIQRPATLQAGLPVVFWIYGGGLTTGSITEFHADNLIRKSISLGGPIVYVATNYRLGAFGWLPGQEVLDAGISNLGLLDQRLALQWVADNIAKFGGDPSKVVIWGESAGSVSVFNQMVLYKGNNTYKGKPLFRGAIMNSGSVVPAEPVNGEKGQSIYDTVVNVGGCSSAADTLTCLRNLSFDDLFAASNAASVDTNYQSTAGGYKARPDGVVIADSPEILIYKGQYAKVPFIVGDEEDEGTKMAMVTSNITNTTDIINYFSTEWFMQTPRTLVAQLVNTYPNNPAAGSPFRTGSANNEPYIEYKRMAALMGDLGFTLTRRVFLAYADSVSPSIPSWSYLGSQNYGTPIIGTSHASDVGADYGNAGPVFYSQSVMTYFISFFNALDPNALAGNLTNWPRWSAGQNLLWFKNTTNDILADNFRNASYTILYDNASMFRI